jgi:hypothetical protein
VVLIVAMSYGFVWLANALRAQSLPTSVEPIVDERDDLPEVEPA